MSKDSFNLPKFFKAFPFPIHAFAYLGFNLIHSLYLIIIIDNNKKIIHAHLMLLQSNKKINIIIIY